MTTSEKFLPWSDPRNLVDKYKGWSEEDIRQSLQEISLPLVVAICNIDGDFNISTVLRNANAFGATAVHYIGKRKWDRRGAVGVQNYTAMIHWDDPITFIRAIHLTGYKVIALEQAPDSFELPQFKWPVASCILLGEERLGLSEDVLAACDGIVEIPQRGSVRSLNAGVASGIAMYSYSLQHS